MAGKAKPGAEPTQDDKDKNKKPDPAAGDPEEEEEGAEADDKADDDDQDPKSASDDEMKDWAPDKVKSHVQDLRKENAKHRTEKKALKTQLNNLQTQFQDFQGKLKTALGGEADDETSPEEKVGALTQTVGVLQWENAVKDIAIENGIAGKKQLSYFKHLLSERMTELEEGEELEDGDYEAVVKEVKSVFGGKGGSSSVPGGQGGGGNPPPPKEGEGGGKVTMADFVKMTTSQKIELHQKNPTLYTQLFTEAVQKNAL